MAGKKIDWKCAGLLRLGTVLFAVYLVQLDWEAVRDIHIAFPGGVAVLVVALNLLTLFFDLRKRLHGHG